jgi:glycosyltransferase involved in cell wall biosynthesis
MKILYLSCHAILEYDECKLLTELGHEVYSHGVYRDPRGAYTLPRPAVPGMKVDETWIQLTADHPKTDLTPEMIEQFDVIIIMSGENEGTLSSNWPRIKHKRVIWRSIGQSTQATERLVARCMAEGMEVVRYSPKERNIPGYAGESALIRFYKDKDEYSGWTGNDRRPINFTQTLKGRGNMAHYDQIMMSLVGFDGAKVYGPGNNDLGIFNGGEVSHDRLKELLRDSGIFVYGGTWPASYTLSFIEAMMTGIPMVALSAAGARLDGVEQFDYYEVGDILRAAGVSTYDDVTAMRAAIENLLNSPELSQEVSQLLRKKAIELFSKEVIAPQWVQLLERQSYAT